VVELGVNALLPTMQTHFSVLQLSPAIKIINLKTNMPPIAEALQRLEDELASARQHNQLVLKIIHGYGSKGVGGDIRISVQRRLREMFETKQIRGCIFGEEWSKSCDEVWKLLQARPELKSDADLGRCNRGITIVLL
jgi:hypothetical protein